MSHEGTRQNAESFAVFFEDLSEEPRLTRQLTPLHVRLGPYQVICNYALAEKRPGERFPPWMVTRMRLVREHSKGPGKFRAAISVLYAPTTFHNTAEAAAEAAWEEVAYLLLAVPGLEVSCEGNGEQAAGRP